MTHNFEYMHGIHALGTHAVAVQNARKLQQRVPFALHHKDDMDDASAKAFVVRVRLPDGARISSEIVMQFVYNNQGVWTFSENSLDVASAIVGRRVGSITNAVITESANADGTLFTAGGYIRAGRLNSVWPPMRSDLLTEQYLPARRHWDFLRKTGVPPQMVDSSAANHATDVAAPDPLKPGPRQRRSPPPSATATASATTTSASTSATTCATAPSNPPPAPGPMPRFTDDVGRFVDGARESLALPVKDLGLGVLFVGQQGSGKTYAMKKVVETAVALPSMRHVVVLDPKGDWSELLDPAQGAAVADIATFDAECDVRVYTLNTEMGWKATLDPFYFDNQQLAALRLDNDDDQHLLDTCVSSLVADVLVSVGLVKIDVDGNAVLQDVALTMPALRSVSGQHGPSVDSRKSLGADLKDAAYKTCKKRFATNNKQLPQSLDSFADALQAALQQPGAISLRPSLKQADLDFAANLIRANAPSAGGPLAPFYRNVAGDEAAPAANDRYALEPKTLCDGGNKRSGKRVKISVVRLSNLEEKEQQQLVVQTILSRLERWIKKSGGSQEAPATMIVIDEGHDAIPKPRSARSTVIGSTGIVKRLLNVRRSEGVIVAIGTHLPQDLDPKILEFLIGPQFIGRLGLDANLKQVLSQMVRRGKNTGKRTADGVANSQIIEAVRGLAANQFVMVPKHVQGSGASTSHRLMKFSKLSRHHEDAGSWRNGRERAVVDAARAAV